MNPTSPAPAVNPREAVSLPGIFLIITGCIGALWALFGMVRGATKIPPEMLNDPNIAKYAPMIEHVGTGAGIVFNLFYLAISALVIFGAIKMRNLQNWGLALTASIIAVIPCVGPCICLGLPFGIWSLIVLNKPEVKAAFTGGSPAAPVA